MIYSTVENLTKIQKTGEKTCEQKANHELPTAMVQNRKSKCLKFLLILFLNKIVTL